MGALSGARRTPQGGLIAPANLTRVGVLNYQQSDGSVIRELRTPEEVFKADSLATLVAAPLTVGHQGVVTPATWRGQAVGHVDGSPTHDDTYVKADVRVMDASTILQIENKELVELSCGYTCDVEQTAGEWNGQKFDAIQHNIEYNHVAIGPKDWGRAGNEVRLRLDGKVSYQDSATYLEKAMPSEEKQQTAPVSAQTPRQDAETETLRGQMAFLMGEKARLEQELAAAKDPAKFDAAVTARADALVAARTSRVALEAAVKTACPELKCDGKSDTEVMVAALKDLRPELKLDGRSADYVSAVFDMAIQGLQDAKRAQAGLQLATPTPGNARDDSARTDAVSLAAEKNAYEQANLWRGAEWLKAHPFKAN